MMALLISLVARIGVPERLRKLAAIALLVVAAITAILLARTGWSAWLARHDRQVIAADRAEASAQASGAALDAERKAGAAKDARDRTFAEQQHQLQEEADAAARASASPLDAVFDRLR